jgi:hypothetical protein
MVLDKGDIEAIARFRAGKGKFMLGMLLFGILWLLGTLVVLFTLTYDRSMLGCAIVGVVAFIIWLIVYLVMIELRTKGLVVKIKEAYEKDIKS